MEGRGGGEEGEGRGEKRRGREGRGRGGGGEGGGEGRGGKGRREGMEEWTPHKKFLDPPLGGRRQTASACSPGEENLQSQEEV